MGRLGGCASKLRARRQVGLYLRRGLGFGSAGRDASIGRWLLGLLRRFLDVGRYAVAIEQVLEQLPLDGLILDQPFGDTYQLVAVASQDLAGHVMGVLDDAPHLGVDVLSGGFAVVALLADLPAQEY